MKDFYEERDGVAMGSPSRHALANSFIFTFENICLENCPRHFKQIVSTIECRGVSAPLITKPP